MVFIAFGLSPVQLCFGFDITKNVHNSVENETLFELTVLVLRLCSCKFSCSLHLEDKRIKELELNSLLVNI